MFSLWTHPPRPEHRTYVARAVPSADANMIQFAAYKIMLAVRNAFSPTVRNKIPVQWILGTRLCVWHDNNWDIKKALHAVHSVRAYIVVVRRGALAHHVACRMPSHTHRRCSTCMCAIIFFFLVFLLLLMMLFGRRCLAFCIIYKQSEWKTRCHDFQNYCIR